MTQAALAESSTPFRSASAMRILAAVGLVAVIATAAFADYLSSWLPKVGGFPAGAIVRDAVAVVFVGLAGAVLLRDRASWSRASLAPRSRAVAGWAFVPFVVFAGWVLLLIVPSPATTPALLASRNLVLYTAVGFAAYVLLARGYLSAGVLIGTITAFGFVAAGLGILDTATHGGIVTSLGHRADYSGVEGSEARLIAGASATFQGYVRASGGISNALVFGYLMAAIGVFAAWMLDRTVERSGWASGGAAVYLVLGVMAGVACIESFTRGAMVALVAGLVILVVLRRSRPIVVGAVATVAVALVVTWAGSGFIVTSPPGQTATPGAGSAPGMLDLIGTRVTSSDESSQESSSLRLDQVRRGFASLAAHPMGNGLGTEGSASNRAGTPGADLTPDVFALIVALQTGIVGAGLYALIFLAMILWAIRGPAGGRGLVLALIGVVAIASILSATPDAPVFATTIWILFLAVSAVAALDDRGIQASRSGR